MSIGITNISSTKLADSMDDHDVDSFWKYIRERNKSKSTMSNCIGGITGEAGIADFWRDHYGSLLNSSLNSEHYQKRTCL